MSDDPSLNSFKITVGNERFQVKTDTDPETLREVAAYVDSKIHETHLSGADDKVGRRQWILLAMNITGELFEWKKTAESLQKSENLSLKAIKDLIQQFESFNLNE